MILVIISSKDKVYSRLINALENCGHPYILLDEEHPEHYKVQVGHEGGKLSFHIVGGMCNGQRPIGSIFVRHSVSSARHENHQRILTDLQIILDRILLYANCHVINPPHNAHSNYSKPYQLVLLSRAGFDVPETLVTNIPREALNFFQQQEKSIIFKGVSNVASFVQLLEDKHLSRLNHAAYSPTQFQEYINGADIRVHIIGDLGFAVRIESSGIDYRHEILSDKKIKASIYKMQDDPMTSCISITKDLGLVVSGIDFKETSDGHLIALELNPYPQFTFYEAISGQPLTQSIIENLVSNRISNSNIFA